MKNLFLFGLLSAVALTSGCTTKRYQLVQAEYSAWKGDVMYLRKKSVLIDTETGETWGLAYDKDNTTEDGYGWEKINRN